jgi:hypothetical protein
MCLERFGHTASVEHAADAVDAEAPEGTLAVLVDQLLESAQLVRASRVELELAALPARPGIGRYSEKRGRFGLRSIAECTSEDDQVQIRAAGRSPSIRHV